MSSPSGESGARPLTTDQDRRARLCAELRRGAAVVVDGADGAGLVMIAAETALDRVLEPLKALSREDGVLAGGVLALSAARAATLKARAYDGDLARLPFEAAWTAARLRALADPAQDLAHPLQGPFMAERGGDATLHRAALGFCRRAQLLPAAACWPVADARAFAARFDLALAAAPRIADGAEWRAASAARVPLAAAPQARLHVFRRVGWDDEHYAVEIGAPRRDAPVLIRLHSACATGDLFGSLKCDCGPQLQAALAAMGAAKGGVLVYLQQEGRGIGLANKMRAYELQDQGFDTVEANLRLGFADDERRLDDGAAILRAMGFRSVRVLTNNPRKLDALRAAGLEVVERVPLQVGETAENAEYLRVKSEKSGHLL